MMASARAEPICGRASSCSLEAELMSISAPWAGAAVVAAGAAGLVAGAAGAGVVVAGFAGVLGAAVWARTGAAIRRLSAVKAAGRDKRIRTLLQGRWRYRPASRMRALGSTAHESLL